MRINVKSLQGDEYVLEVQNDQLVSELKASISEKAGGLSIDRLKLVFKGRTLQDSVCLRDYNLEDGCKVHLIVQKDGSTQPVKSNPASDTRPSKNDQTCPMETATTTTTTTSTTKQAITTDQGQNSSDAKRSLSRFEILLRERLAAYFSNDSVDAIMLNLEHEINADINSSSLDDLERLAKQKLNITNE